VSFALILSGVCLWIADSGGVGQTAPSWIEAAANIPAAALCAWIVGVSIAIRGASILGRSLFWLGMTAGGALLLLVLPSAVQSPAFTSANDTVLPPLALGLLIWLCPGAWLAVFALGLWRQEVGWRINANENALAKA
jgi:hypothetical protein